MEKWKSDGDIAKRFLEGVTKMDNLTLLDEFANLCGGDDYDGCFTTRGNWELTQLSIELDKRLKECGFLKSDDNLLR